MADKTEDRGTTIEPAHIQTYVRHQDYRALLHICAFKIYLYIYIYLYILFEAAF